METKNQFYKNVSGVDVSITQDGKFTAKINGRQVTKSSLAQLEKEIARISSFVVGYRVDPWNGVHYLHPSKIVAIEGGRARRQDGGLEGNFDSFFVLSPDELEQGEDFIRRDQELKNEWKQWAEKLKDNKITVLNFEKLLNKSEQ